MGEFDTIEADGKTFRAYAAGEFERGASGVLLLHAWWGLNDDLLAYADRLAAAGFSVVAPDMFNGQVATTIEEAKGLSGAADADQEAINGIVLAAIDQLAERLGSTAKLSAIGFSFGAHWSMWAPTQRDSVTSSVLYYGTTGDALTEASVAVLGHFAADDPYETEEWVAEFEGILRSAGRNVVMHHYPGTGHWFAEPSKDAYRPEAADIAFERTVAFLNEVGGQTRE